MFSFLNKNFNLRLKFLLMFVSNYTHTKLMKLMTIAWFRVVLQNFAESGPFEFMLKEDSTFSMYSENYRNQAQILINLYNYS